MSNYEQDIMLSELTKGSEGRYNQVKAAKLLGISRGSLRYKLKEYFGDKYVGSK